MNILPFLIFLLRSNYTYLNSMNMISFSWIDNLIMVQSKSNDANFTLLTEHSLLPIYEYQMRSQLNLLCNAKVEFKSSQTKPNWIINNLIYFSNPLLANHILYQSNNSWQLNISTFSTIESKQSTLISDWSFSLIVECKAGWK